MLMRFDRWKIPFHSPVYHICPRNSSIIFVLRFCAAPLHLLALESIADLAQIARSRIIGGFPFWDKGWANWEDTHQQSDR